MKQFRTRLREAVEVGSWKLEDKPRESFKASTGLKQQTNRLLGLVATHGDRIANGAWDLGEYNPTTTSGVLFTYKSHPISRAVAEIETPRYQEIDLRFSRGVRVEGREIILSSIFHTEELTVDEERMEITSPFDLVGGRKARYWHDQGIPGVFKVPDSIGTDAAEFDSVSDLEAVLEEICPTTPEGFESILANHFVVDQIAV